MPKLCKTCGSQLQKRKNESEPRFQAKKYCSGKCARADFKKEKRGWYSQEFDQHFDKEVTNYEFN